PVRRTTSLMSIRSSMATPVALDATSTSSGNRQSSLRAERSNPERRLGRPDCFVAPLLAKTVPDHYDRSFMLELLTLFAIVFGVNLLPAFGPPTWAVLVLYVLNTDLHPALLIPVAALAAASGRLLLALAFRLLGNRLPKKYRSNLAAAKGALEKNRRNAILALALFALSPVPSAQLFEAAGLAGVRLLPFTLAFFLSRAISYSIYVFP